jgi:hypothetical protein
MAETIRKPKVEKTNAELKQELALLRKKVVELEQKTYAGELEELIKSAGVAAIIADIKTKVEGATDIAILVAIAKSAGLKRIVVTQTDAPKRKVYPRKTVTKKAATKK